MEVGGSVALEVWNMTALRWSHRYHSRDPRRRSHHCWRWSNSGGRRLPRRACSGPGSQGLLVCSCSMMVVHFQSLAAYGQAQNKCISSSIVLLEVHNLQESLGSVVGALGKRQRWVAIWHSNELNAPSFGEAENTHLCIFFLSWTITLYYEKVTEDTACGSAPLGGLGPLGEKLPLVRLCVHKLEFGNFRIWLPICLFTPWRSEV